MRIAINARLWQPRYMEGIGRHLVEVLKELLILMPDARFLLIFDRPPHVAYPLVPQVNIRVAGPPARHPVLYEVWFNMRIPYILRHWRADVFWSPDNFCSMRAPCPTLLTVHDLAYLHYPEQLDPAHRFYYRIRMPVFLNKADHIAAVSHFTARDIEQNGRISAEKISVVCNGASTKPASQAEVSLFRDSRTCGRPYFLYVGSIHPRKNVARLIAAYDQYRHNGGAPWPLIIIGRQAWKTIDMQTGYGNSPFKEDIRLMGYLPDDEVHQWLGAAGALVYVSLFEGFGMPVLEAMQAGVPVITSAESSMSEVGAGAVIEVNPIDKYAISDAMLHISQDVSLRNTCIDRGLKRASAYTWTKSAAVYADIFTKLYKMKRPR